MSKPHKKSKRSYRKKKARRMKQHAEEHAKGIAVLNSYKPYKLEVRNDWPID
ncbi:hypothetical protein QUW45_02360 [Limosilactobacillus pontis]|uniref:hypothetical protein n=1 Tax=Limosilactobacillus pontis TaxID=35787 RepID=UPI0025A3EE14|nr:hypothetical protein [Limosilactobacillus pontis]MDM8331533.1 hypothetical protein [Limosilactobacillus pontis]